MSEIEYKPQTRYAFVHDGTTVDWANYLFTTPESAKAFGGDWKGRIVKVEISAVEVSPEFGRYSPVI